MRILSTRQVKELVLYSPRHIAQLEVAGQFPERVQLRQNGWDGMRRKFWTGSRNVSIVATDLETLQNGSEAADERSSRRLFYAYGLGPRYPWLGFDRVANPVETW